jgi:methylmalonyl-CoA mutase, C-terminal domain
MAIRVVVAKPGLDGHDRGAKVVARALRDAGMEVIYTGCTRRRNRSSPPPCRRTPRPWPVVHSGAHLTLFPRVVELLRDAGADDVVVFGGGIIPAADVQTLKEAGVAEVFTPGTPMKTITDWVEANVASRT